MIVILYSLALFNFNNGKDSEFTEVTENAKADTTSLMNKSGSVIFLLVIPCFFVSGREM